MFVHNAAIHGESLLQLLSVVLRRGPLLVEFCERFYVEQRKYGGNSLWLVVVSTKKTGADVFLRCFIKSPDVSGVIFIVGSCGARSPCRLTNDIYDLTEGANFELPQVSSEIVLWPKLR